MAVTIRELSEPPPFAHRGRPLSALLQTDLPVPDDYVESSSFDFVGDGDGDGETTEERAGGDRSPQRRAHRPSLSSSFFPDSGRSVFGFARLSVVRLDHLLRKFSRDFLFGLAVDARRYRLSACAVALFKCSIRAFIRIFLEGTRDDEDDGDDTRVDALRRVSVALIKSKIFLFNVNCRFV